MIDHHRLIGALFARRHTVTREQREQDRETIKLNRRLIEAKAKHPEVWVIK